MKPRYTTWIAPVILLIAAGTVQAQNMHHHNTASESHQSVSPSSAHHITPAQQPAAHTSQTVQGTGTIKSINPERRRITITHDPIPELQWPEMTMPSTVSDTALLEGLAPGDQVCFELQDGQVITAITKN